MTKKSLGIVFVVLVVIIVILSIMNSNSQNKYDGNIVSFTYNYSSGSGANNYSINVENGKATFVANEYGDSVTTDDIDKEIASSYLKELANIINNKGINAWNGFEVQDDDSASDGSGFYLKVEYDNGEILEASGYSQYPNNYDSGHDALVKFFEKIK
jgi:hypothetical protein